MKFIFAIFQDKVNNKKNVMNVATAMATLGMANTRGLEDPAIGPMLLSHASVMGNQYSCFPWFWFDFSFQSRIHLLEESRAFSLIHGKKQEWYKSLPKIARTQKHTNTKNKFRVS